MHEPDTDTGADAASSSRHESRLVIAGVHGHSGTITASAQGQRQVSSRCITSSTAPVSSTNCTSSSFSTTIRVFRGVLVLMALLALLVLILPILGFLGALVLSAALTKNYPKALKRGTMWHY